MKATVKNKHGVVYREYIFEGKTSMSWDIFGLLCLRQNKVELQDTNSFFI